MQLGEAQKGFSSKSELFKSLKVYLDNKNRLQPIIGLGSIIECVKADAYNREALYMCEVCVCRLSKADMRNHIMGTLHRYNYIKAWYPHLVSGWKDNSDLSKLAWPLMDIAKTLESQEGPGEVQLLLVEDEVHQKMATYSENDAITLISSLRDGQGYGEPESHPEAAAVHSDHYPSQSHRIVLLAQNQLRGSEKSFKADMTSPHHMLSEPSMLSGSTECFFDGYTGPKPLIGLFRLIECRSENGHIYCFLCHCCRTRCNRRGIIDHLTSSSHMIKYLMETRPEQVEGMTAAGNHNCKILKSLAQKVEQEEGRGVLKVVNVPEAICILMTSKCYTWCMRRLRNGWADFKWVYNRKRKRKKKKKKANNTVFKIRLPSNKGAVLLERTSFSKNSLPVSCANSPSFDSDLRSSPVYKIEEHLQAQNEELSPAVSHTQDWTSYDPSSACKEDYAEQWYNAVSLSKTGTGVEVSSEEGQKEMNSDAAWLHYQQWHQYMTQDHASLVPHSVGHHGLSGELVPHFDAAGINMYPYLGDYHVHSASTAPESRTQFHEVKQRPLQAYMEVTIGYVPTAHQNFAT